MSVILLVNPVHPPEQRYGGFSVGVAPIYPPLGLLYLAAYLRQEGSHRVKILDAEAEQLTIDVMRRRLEQHNADLIGVTLRTAAYSQLAPIMQKLKRQGKKIVAGGIHPTIDPESILRAGSADYIVRGEGEQTLLELLEHLAGRVQLAAIKGISYCSANGEIIHNPDRPLLDDLDRLPMPARDLLDMSQYHGGPQHYKQLPHTSMMASRGCPYDCSFCSSRSLWGRRYRLRSVASVTNEIEHLQTEYGIRDICFWDDLWGLEQGWVKEFCEWMRGRGLTWSCEARVDTLTEELVAAMAKAGCFCIFFGFESLDEETLQRIGKNTTLDQIENVTRWAQRYGIEVRANFILGLPGETRQQAERNFKKICRMNFDFVKFNIFTPYPGTAAYDLIIKSHPERLNNDLSRYTGYFTTYLPEDYATAAELENLRTHLLRSYYLRPRYIFKRVMRLTSFVELKKNLIGLRALLGGG